VLQAQRREHGGDGIEAGRGKGRGTAKIVAKTQTALRPYDIGTPSRGRRGNRNRSIRRRTRTIAYNFSANARYGVGWVKFSVGPRAPDSVSGGGIRRGAEGRKQAEPTKDFGLEKYRKPVRGVIKTYTRKRH